MRYIGVKQACNVLGLNVGPSRQVPTLEQLGLTIIDGPDYGRGCTKMVEEAAVEALKARRDLVSAAKLKPIAGKQFRPTVEAMAKLEEIEGNVKALHEKFDKWFSNNVTIVT